MKKIFKEYKKVLADLIKNKFFTIIILLVTILSYGFTITHYSIGMDDTAFDRYYIGKEMLGIGRWGAYIIYMLLGIVEFTPFWADFVSTAIILFTAILWCTFLNKNLIKKLPITAYIIFASIYISFPIINEMFIFQNCNIAVMLGYFLVSLGIILFYENYINEKNKSIYLLCIGILTFGISTYEACIQTALVGISITTFILLQNKKIKTKEILKYFCFAIFILGISAILDIVISKIIYIAGVPVSDVAEKGINWSNYTFIESLVLLFLYIKDALTNIRYMPVVIFDFAAIIGFIIITIKSYKENKIIGLLLFIVMFLSNFAISILKLDGVMYRASVSWGLFVALICMVIYLEMSKYKITKILTTLALIILILQQTRYLNQLFYNDYIRYQRDLNIANQLIYDLEKNYDIRKPLVIAGTPKKEWGRYGAQSNSLSVLWWGQKAFTKGEEFIKFLNSLGYYFRFPTDEQYEEGILNANNMERYPKDGSIVEFDDYILINF